MLHPTITWRALNVFRSDVAGSVLIDASSINRSCVLFVASFALYSLKIYNFSFAFIKFLIKSAKSLFLSDKIDLILFTNYLNYSSLIYLIV